MTKRLLVFGGDSIGKTALLEQSMKEKHGDDIELVTIQEAQERGLKPEDFENVPSYPITAHPILEQPHVLGFQPSGRESRRKRREQERKLNKKRNKH